MLLSELPVGACVKDTGTSYNGENIIFRILEHGHTGDPEGTTTLECRDIITIKCFDAREPNNSNIGRVNYGNNRYLYSNLLLWLNSNQSSWYSAQHSADEPPISGYIWEDDGVAINPYDAEAGFLTNFSVGLKSALQTASKVTAKNTVTDGGGSEAVSSKIFLLSRTEVGLGNENSIAEGSVYSLYSSDSSKRIKNLANDAAKGNYSSAVSPWLWWLRTPRYDWSNWSRDVWETGVLGSTEVYYGGLGVSPAFCIPSDTTLTSDTPDESGIYTLVFPIPRIKKAYINENGFSKLIIDNT